MLIILLACSFSYWFGVNSIPSTKKEQTISEKNEDLKISAQHPPIKLQVMPETLIIRNNDCDLQDTDKWKTFERTATHINMDVLLEYQNDLFGNEIAKQIIAIKVLVNIADYGTLQWMEGLLFEPQTADVVKLSLLQHLPWYEENLETLIDIFHANEANVKILNRVSLALRNVKLTVESKEDLDNHMFSLFLDNPSVSETVQVAVIDYFQQSADKLDNLVRLVAIGSLSKNVMARLKVLQQQGKIPASIQLNKLLQH